MYNMLFYIILLAFCGSSLACPDVKPAKNCDISKYISGTWYEIARYDTYDAEAGAGCITYTFLPTTTRVHNATIKEVKGNNLKIVNNQLIETDDPGKVIFHSGVSAIPNLTTLVLATDNENYYVFYNCIVDNKQQVKEYSWIVAKTPNISPELKAVIHKYVDETHVLDSSKFKYDRYSHGDCVVEKN